MQQLRMELGQNSYDIFLENGLLQRAGADGIQRPYPEYQQHQRPAPDKVIYFGHYIRKSVH